MKKLDNWIKCVNPIIAEGWSTKRITSLVQRRPLHGVTSDENRQTTDRELDIFRIELVYHKITTELRHRWKRIVQRCDITKWSWKNLQFQTTNKALPQTTDDYYMVSGKMLYVAFCQVGFPRMNLKSSSVEHDVAKNKEEKENTTRLNVTW